MLFALGIIFILLLGEIDLSIGFIGGVASVVTATMVFGDHGYPWWIGVPVGLLCGAAIGCFNGIIITGIGLPLFHRHARRPARLERRHADHPRQRRYGSDQRQRDQQSRERPAQPDCELDRRRGDRAGDRRRHDTERAAPEALGSAAQRAHPQDCRHPHRRHRRRDLVQREPRSRHDRHSGRAVGAADRLRLRGAVDRRPPAHALRYLCLCHRRQLRSRPPRRHRRQAHPHRLLHHLGLHGRGSRA